jgi:glycosyltransferase involved in cell wall biosynthesis
MARVDAVLEKTMKVCLICVEIFAWGKYGGFGRATRMIGRELVKRGIEVFAVIPRRKGQKKVEYLDGFQVLSYPMHNPFVAVKAFKFCNADIYHSLQPSFASYLAMKSMPAKKHIITFRDPHEWQDWKIEFNNYSKHKLQVLLNKFFEDNIFVTKTVRRADGNYSAAFGIMGKAKRKYRLSYAPGLLPTPIALGNNIIKSKKPTVCFLGRLVRRKQPELFCRLAEAFPDVQFFAAGEGRDKKYANSLRKQYGCLPNLEFTGFLDQFNSSACFDLLSKSWILVNTSVREGLPTSFLEALAHKCAILSSVNTEDVAMRFGYHAKKNDFAAGLSALLDNYQWQKKGEAGYKYVQDYYEINKAIDMHLAEYVSVLHSS